MNDPPSGRDPRKKHPLQFSLRGLLGLSVIAALLFGGMNWLEVPPAASAVVLVILLVAIVAAVGFAATLADIGDEDRNE